MEKVHYRIGDVVARRKYELFNRDPLAQRIDKVYRKYGMNSEMSPEELRFQHDEENIEDLKIKWNCTFNINRDVEVVSDKFFWWLDFIANTNPTISCANEYVQDVLAPKIEDRLKSEKNRAILEKGGVLYTWERMETESPGSQPGREPNRKMAILSSG